MSYRIIGLTMLAFVLNVGSAGAQMGGSMMKEGQMEMKGTDFTNPSSKGK